MANKLNAKATGYTLASVAGIVSLACLLLIVIAKEFTINLFGAIFHGIDLTSYPRSPYPKHQLGYG